MSAPYVSSRSGRFQWMMQRVSAVLLLFLAFGHFGLQHFTADACQYRFDRYCPDE